MVILSILHREYSFLSWCFKIYFLILCCSSSGKELFNLKNCKEQSSTLSPSEAVSQILISKKLKTSPEIQEKAVEGLIKRLIPEHFVHFFIKVDPSFLQNKSEIFKITSPLAANDSRVGIVGTTGVTVSWGLLHYLKYYCHNHVSWNGNQIYLPKTLPRAKVKIVALDRFRYYQNVCTSSYSFVWWKWKEWERHIDWMALNGINFPLAFVGQETIWQRVYQKFNFTQEDINDHFAGPGFLAWGRMGNIQKWGGPLRKSWYKKSLSLQHKILLRMREFGMTPILPAFAGHVPSAITRIFPEAKVTRLGRWGKFTNDNYTRTYILDPQDPLFSDIGEAFIKEMQFEYNGTDHVYNCDPFNEMRPTNNSKKYLRTIGKAIFKAMLRADEKSVWVIQGWMFRDSGFWTYDAAKALLTSVPQGRMIILDLTSDVDPQYARLDSYFGQPFIFCMLHNYGGVDGMYGNIQLLLKNMKEARKYPNGSLVGIGLTPEGINQNYVMYDLMLEMGWRINIEVDNWMRDYSKRRYGSSSAPLSQAWTILGKTVYNCPYNLRFHGNHILIQHRPNFLRKELIWYSIRDFVRVWDLFVSVLDSNKSEILIKGNNNQEMNKIPKDYLKENLKLIHQETFQHDLIDVTRQALQILGGKLIERIRKFYIKQSASKINEIGIILIELLEDLDLMLEASEHFLLGRWLKDASGWATTPQEKSQYIKNAKYQLTLWGPNGEILDYAIKQWNGIVKDYFAPRWKLFYERLVACVREHKEFNQHAFNEGVFKLVEKPFAEAKNNSNYSPVPRGNALEKIKFIYKKYRIYFDLQKIS